VNWIEGVVVYVLVWWVVIFAVLPWGVRPPAQFVPGQALSAPGRPRLWFKAGITTLVAAVIWLIIFLIVRSNWISFRGS
jgi:predicted secreted protein